MVPGAKASVPRVWEAAVTEPVVLSELLAREMEPVELVSCEPDSVKLAMRPLVELKMTHCSGCVPTTSAPGEVVQT
jgi:hypothetical protein